MSSPTAVLHVKVFPRLYRDSVTLMALAAQAERTDGVQRVGAVMATPANLDILTRSQMVPKDLAAGPDDLLITVRADDDTIAASALEQAASMLTAADQSSGGGAAKAKPATVAEGLAAEAGLSIATISTPGTYAPIVGEQALRAGLHVFCFSDNVSVADEVRLKQIAADKGLLFMGPDCGTAIIDGVPLGFANVVRPGPVGIVAASGTGAQEVSCLLDGAGTGVRQLIGVGGHDLSEAVGATMTNLALDMLAADDEVKVVVVVSKPPAKAVADQLLQRLAGLGKPAVACLLGLDDADGPVPVRGTLEGGALAAMRLVAVEPPAQLVHDAAPPAPVAARPAGVRGLYTGGTLASEATVILTRAGVAAEILDLGDDQYTVGRPHPMIDPTIRSQYVADTGNDANTGVLLVDLVLGYGAASDPATPLAEAIVAARAAASGDGRELLVLASVCGTCGDPQPIEAQRDILTAAGAVVFPSNAAAARMAATVATMKERA